MHLYNRNILDYSEIEVTDSNSKIHNIEGHSNIERVWRYFETQRATKTAIEYL